MIDAHQHFWNPAERYYPWMPGAPESLAAPFAPDDLAPQLAAAGVDETIVVQAVGTLEESVALLATAASIDFIAGVVGWVDLAADAPAQLDALRTASGGEFLVGVRHQVENEPPANWFEGPSLAGLAALGERGLAYDVLIRVDQLDSALTAIRRNPGVKFVVDHLWKAALAGGDLGVWSRGLRRFAAEPNVAVKLSGTAEGRPAVLRNYLDQVLADFGASRIMFGSDWPVSTLAASYFEVVESAISACSDLTAVEREAVFGGTARIWYRLES